MGYEQSAPLSPSWGELDALVDELTAARAAVAAAQAHETEVLARAVPLVEARTADRRARGQSVGNDLPLREVCAELGAAMRVGDRTVQRRIDDAHTVVIRFPATFEAWRRGQIERAHVSAILDEGTIIADPELRARYESLVLDVAVVESAGRLREIARVIAARVDAAASDLRRKAAPRGREVRLIDLHDGMSRVQADVRAPFGHAIMDALTQYARAVRLAETAHNAAEPDDAAAPRTFAQIRADVFTDLLLSGTPTAHRDADGRPLPGIRGEIHVTIPVSTAAGIDDQPALLAGYGPIDSELARELMAASPVWNRVVLDLPTGLPLAVDRYRPSSELKRFLDFRDERCRFPGCAMRARRCDGDHTVDAALGGVTSAGNLADLCRRHHTLKHASPWSVEQLGLGRLRWTSPTGRVYDDDVPATLRFVRSIEPEEAVPARWGAARMPARSEPTERAHDLDPPPF